jgi:hypothetical protein
MALRDKLTEQLALSMLARDGIAAIWQLHLSAADAHRTVIPKLLSPSWNSLKLPRKHGSGLREHGV